MTEVINEIVAQIDQIVFWLKVTVYLALGICIVWVIRFNRRNLGLDTYSIELRRIRRILEDHISQKQSIWLPQKHMLKDKAELAKYIKPECEL